MINCPHIPKDFEDTILSTWGQKGRAWLDRLPSLIDTYTERWGLTIRSPLPSPSYSFVAFVKTPDATDAVLKMAVPNPELHTEVDALRAFAGGPAVPLLEADPDHGALLLQRISPGTPLTEIEDDEYAIAIAASLIGDLPVAPPEGNVFPTVERWARAFDRLRTRFGGSTGPVPAHLVDKAERLLTELQATERERALLHGDLHHRNILLSEEDGWLAIDPKGVIGDPVYEAARLQHNPIPGLLKTPSPRAVAQRRVEILAAVLEEDPARLLGWAFFDAVLAACWSVEEDGRQLDHHLACVRLLDELVG